MAPLVLGAVSVMHREEVRTQTPAGPPSSTTGLEGRLLGGRYRVLRELGAGAMGRVYLAQHALLDRACAVKVIRSRPEPEPSERGDDTERTPSDGDAIARFRVEALAASRLDHPNVLRVLDFGCEDESLWYLVTEHLDGEDLLDVLDAQRVLGTRRIVAIARQLCAALQHAHDHGVVHRDIKPENIRLVRREGDDGALAERVKVLDFGTARILHEDGTQAPERLVIGTPAYMSPEQASGADVDARADLYACGVLLFEMATGRLPFERASPIALAAAHVECPPPAPSAIYEAIDPELESIILWCLRKRPSERPQSARELRDALDRIGTRVLDRDRRATKSPTLRWTPIVDQSELAAAGRVPLAKRRETVSSTRDTQPSRRNVAAPPRRARRGKPALVAACVAGLLGWSCWQLLEGGAQPVRAAALRSELEPAAGTILAPPAAAVERAPSATQSELPAGGVPLVRPVAAEARLSDTTSSPELGEVSAAGPRERVVHSARGERPTSLGQPGYARPTVIPSPSRSPDPPAKDAVPLAPPAPTPEAPTAGERAPSSSGIVDPWAQPSVPETPP